MKLDLLCSDRASLIPSWHARWLPNSEGLISSSVCCSVAKTNNSSIVQLDLHRQMVNTLYGSANRAIIYQRGLSIRSSADTFRKFSISHSWVISLYSRVPALWARLRFLRFNQYSSFATGATVPFARDYLFLGTNDALMRLASSLRFHGGT